MNCDKAETLGAELIGAEPVFEHVCFTVGAVSEKMFAADKAQVLAANTAANKINP